jgi:hypothetical protein
MTVEDVLGLLTRNVHEVLKERCECNAIKKLPSSSISDKKLSISEKLIEVRSNWPKQK